MSELFFFFPPPPRILIIFFSWWLLDSPAPFPATAVWHEKIITPKLFFAGVFHLPAFYGCLLSHFLGWELIITHIGWCCAIPVRLGVLLPHVGGRCDLRCVFH